MCPFCTWASSCAIAATSSVSSSCSAVPRSTSRCGASSVPSTLTCRCLVEPVPEVANTTGTRTRSAAPAIFAASWTRRSVGSSVSLTLTAVPSSSVRATSRHSRVVASSAIVTGRANARVRRNVRSPAYA